MCTAVRSTCSLLGLALVMMLLPAALSAQTTFTVTTAPKTAAHPYFGQPGHEDGFMIDGVEGKELTLMRGTIYTFQLQNVPQFHPFYLSTSADGGGAAPYTAGVTGTPATGNAVVTFAPDASTPDLLWYQCNFHPKMGWRINIVDATSSVDIDPGATLSALLSNPSPNPVASSSSMTLQVGRQQSLSVTLYSASGEKVATLHEGMSTPGQPLVITLDAAGLSNGIYDIVARGESFVEHRRVVVMR
jgi:hypothetical protein